jgi:aquaglyceroporin related protein
VFFLKSQLILAQLDYMTAVSSFFSEFLATAMLMIGILAVTDKRNSAPSGGVVPLALFVLILGIGGALGMQTGTRSAGLPE